MKSVVLIAAFNSLQGNVIETYATGHLRAKYTKEMAGQYRCSAENSVAKIEKGLQVKHFGTVS